MNMTDIQVIELKGVRVLTTAQLAECYETDSKVIHDNFANNKKHYEEGKHFICLKGAELKEFKNLPENIGIVDKHSPPPSIYGQSAAHCFTQNHSTPTRHGKSTANLSRHISERRKRRSHCRICHRRHRR